MNSPLGPSGLLRPPQALTQAHRCAGFDCGQPVLNDWLLRRAWVNQHSGASRTFVVTDEASQVWAYYALAAGAVAHQDATGGVRRNMPDPIPVLVLARLAVDQRAHGQHLGAALLKDAVLRAASVAQNAGVRALLVHALDANAQRFYLHHGFTPAPTNAMMLMLRLTPPV